MGVSRVRRADASVAVVDVAGSGTAPPEQVLRDADMLVLTADAAASPDTAPAATLAEAARARGILVAAVVVAPDGSVRSALLGALRDAADMVMLVRDPANVRAVIAALR